MATHHQGVSRRKFLETVALGAATAGIAPRIALGAPPAAIKGAKISVLQATYFIGPAQELFKNQCEEFAKVAGVTVTPDFLNWPDLQPKIAAAVQAGGVDCVDLWPGWNFLYQKNLVDLTKEAEDFGKRNGGYEPYVLNSGKVNGRWLGIPNGYSNGSINYRVSVFKEAGVAHAEDGAKVDLTWEQYHAVAKKAKAKGLPFGQALGHSTGDPPGFCYPYMWSYGAMELAKDGKTTAFNKPEFVEGMRKFIEAWKDGYDETGTSWDDSNNNRAFLAGQISSTFNGSSIYFAAKKQNPELAADLSHMLMPKGPAGRFNWLETRTWAILKSSKNVEASKEFLRWWFQDEQYLPWWRLQEGYHLQPVKKLATDPMWAKDPKMTAFKDEPKYGRNTGYAGPPNEKAALAWSKYIVVDTFARAVQSGDPKGAIAWGAEQLSRIYRA